jgi:hypothetical protein
MAWEARKEGRYYYQKRRVSGRVVSFYVGAGLSGQIAAEADQARRQREQAARDDLRESDALDSILDDLIEATDILTDATLIAAGFHRHKREWRRRRDD